MCLFPRLPNWCWTLSITPPPATLTLNRFSLAELRPVTKLISLGQLSICLVYLPNDPQVPSYIFLLSNQRPRLKHNQRLRSFWLDAWLYLEVSTLIRLIPINILIFLSLHLRNPIKNINYFNRITFVWNFPKCFDDSLEYLCPSLPTKFES